jgi:hypothetical protein
MQQGSNSYNIISSRVSLLEIKSFCKKAHAKKCKHINAEGFCIRSNSQCPATLFTLTFNN